jgi:hypothetical protein
VTYPPLKQRFAELRELKQMFAELRLKSTLRHLEVKTAIPTLTPGVGYLEFTKNVTGCLQPNMAEAHSSCNSSLT